MRRYFSLLICAFLLQGVSVYSQTPQAAVPNAGFQAQHTGGRIKLFFNRAASALDPKAYTNVKFSPAGDQMRWSSSGTNSYEVRGPKGEVLYRKTYNASPNTQKMNLSGQADVEGFARYQGKLVEARAKMDLTRAQAQSLRVKSQSGLASPQELKTLKGLEKQIPKYEKAYTALEKQSHFKSGAPRKTTALARGFKGALTSVGIYAGAQILSDAISNNGQVDPGRALAPMLQPSFLTGIGGGAVGAMIMSRLPIPGIGGGILKALPMFLGGAVGFETGSGNLDKTNWTKLIASTTASALAFGLIGGPIGIGASILAGMAMDKLLGGDQENTPIMGYEPQWQAMSQPLPAGQPIPNQEMMAPPQVQPSVIHPFPQQPTLPQPQVQSPPVPPEPVAQPAQPGEVQDLKAAMGTHYQNYIQLLKNRQGAEAKKEYELYKKAKSRLQALGR